MKKLLAVLALAAASAACQPQASSTRATAGPAPATARHGSAVVRTAPAVASSLTPAALALLRQHDIAGLLQSVTTDGDSARQVQNGFFGPAGYRLEMALLKVQRDPAQPTVFRVRGKSRYKKVITPFSGTITITELADQPKYSVEEVAEGSLNLPNMYTAVGKFELREDTTRRGAGVFRGRVALDLRINDDGTVQQQLQTMHTLTQGGGVKYEGTWTNNATGHAVPVVWVENIFAYQGPQMLSNFIIGERSPEFNPKYAKLGWNNYWANDEWWAETPKASARL